MKDVSTGNAINKIHKNGLCAAKNKMQSILRTPYNPYKYES